MHPSAAIPSVRCKPLFSRRVGSEQEQLTMTGSCAICRIRLLGFEHICNSLIKGKVCSSDVASTNTATTEG